MLILYYTLIQNFYFYTSFRNSRKQTISFLKKGQAGKISIKRGSGWENINKKGQAGTKSIKGKVGTKSIKMSGWDKIKKKGQVGTKSIKMIGWDKINNWFYSDILPQFDIICT